jgi:hypothetical protein
MPKPNNKKPSGSGKQQRAYPIQGSKEFTIIEYLHSGRSLHRFQAETLGDHCLPTTISTISRKYALEIPRETIQIRNRFGTLTHVMRYWFSEEDKIKINSLR